MRKKIALINGDAHLKNLIFYNNDMSCLWLKLSTIWGKYTAISVHYTTINVNYSVLFLYISLKVLRLHTSFALTLCRSYPSFTHASVVSPTHTHVLVHMCRQTRGLFSLHHNAFNIWTASFQYPMIWGILLEYPYILVWHGIRRLDISQTQWIIITSCRNHS